MLRRTMHALSWIAFLAFVFFAQYTPRFLPEEYCKLDAALHAIVFAAVVLVLDYVNEKTKGR